MNGNNRQSKMFNLNSPRTSKNVRDTFNSPAFCYVIRNLNYFLLNRAFAILYTCCTHCLLSSQYGNSDNELIDFTFCISSKCSVSNMNGNGRIREDPGKESTDRWSIFGTFPKASFSSRIMIACKKPILEFLQASFIDSLFANDIQAPNVTDSIQSRENLNRCTRVSLWALFVRGL